MVHAHDVIDDRADDARRPQVAGHRPLILNWFRAKGQLLSGVVEGFNAKAKLTTRKAYGFRTTGRKSLVSSTWRPPRAKVHPRFS